MASYKSIINTVVKKEDLEQKSSLPFNCNKDTAANPSSSEYDVVYPTKSGVRFGSGDIIPMTGGAIVRFSVPVESGETVHKNIYDKNKSYVSGLLSSLDDLKISKTNITEITSQYSSEFLNSRLKIQKYIKGLSSNESSLKNAPSISMNVLKTKDGKAPDGSTKVGDFSEFSKEISSNDLGVKLGKFSYLSPYVMLKILELLIPGSYIKLEKAKEESVLQEKYIPLIRSDSGISILSLYISLRKYLLSRDDDNGNNSFDSMSLKIKSHLNGASDYDSYLENSDLKKYSDLKGGDYWNSSLKNVILDFLIKEIFQFLVPIIKPKVDIVKDTDDNEGVNLGFYTLMDIKSGSKYVSIGYLKTPDLTFESASGDIDRSEIKFGLKKEISSKSGVEYKDKEYDQKKFLYFDFNFLKMTSNSGKRKYVPIKYLPIKAPFLTGGTNPDFVKANVTNITGDLLFQIDVKDIVGGEFESFGLTKAPDFKDYSIALVPAKMGSGSEKFSFFNNVLSRSVRSSEFGTFVYPNCLGGVVADTSVNISSNNPEKDLEDPTMPLGNFSLPILEEISENFSKHSSWFTVYKKSLQNWYNNQISLLYSKEFCEDSNFKNNAIPKAKGLISDIDNATTSYRSYLLLNGIPTSEGMVQNFGFKSTQDYLNFSSRLDLSLFDYGLENKTYKDNVSGVLAKQSFLNSEDGILHCRPRVLDNSSTPLINGLNIIPMSSISISKDSKDITKVDIKISASKLKKSNILSSDDKKFFSVYIIDRLGQYRRLSRQILLENPTVKDFDSLVENGFGSGKSLSTNSPLHLTFTSDQTGVLSGLAAINFYSDKDGTNLLGTSLENITFKSDGTASVKSAKSWGEAFNLPDDFAGIGYTGVTYQGVMSKNFGTNIGQEIPSTGIDLDIDEFSFNPAIFKKYDLDNLPVVYSGKLPKLVFSSKSRLFGKGNQISAFFAAEISEARDLSKYIDIYKDFSFVQNIFVIKVNVESKEKIFLVSRDLYISETEASPVPPLFGLGAGGKKSTFTFPPSRLQNSNLDRLYKIKNASVIFVGGDINSDVISTASEDYLNSSASGVKTRKLKVNKFSIIKMGSEEYPPFTRPPNVLQLATLSSGITKISGISDYLLTEVANSTDPFIKKYFKGFDFSKRKISSNLNLDTSFSVILAISGKNHDNKNLDFFSSATNTGKLTELGGNKKVTLIGNLKNSANEENYSVQRIDNIKSLDNGEYELIVTANFEKYDVVVSGTNMVRSSVNSISLNEKETSLNVLDDISLVKSNKSGTILLTDKIKDIFNDRSQSFVSTNSLNQSYEIRFSDTGKNHITSNIEISAMAKPIGSSSSQETKFTSSQEPGFTLNPGAFLIEKPSISFSEVKNVLLPELPDLSGAIQIGSQGVQIGSQTSGGLGVGFTLPQDPFNKANPMGSLSSALTALPTSNSKQQKYISSLSSIMIKSGTIVPISFLTKTVLNSPSYELLINNDLDKPIADKYKDAEVAVLNKINLSLNVYGVNKLTFGMPKIISAVSEQRQLDLKNIELNGDGPLTITVDGNMAEGSSLYLNGLELEAVQSFDGTNTTFVANVKMSDIEEAVSNQKLNNLAGISFVSDPDCPWSLSISDSNADIKKVGGDKSRFNNENNPNFLDIQKSGLGRFDPEDVMKDIDLVELVYGRFKIRKPAIDMQALRSFCDLSLHMTAELRLQLRGFQNLLVIIKVIFCIIDVICALLNPRKIALAVARLFLCLLDLVLILPQIAIPIAFIKLLIHFGDLLLCLIVKIVKIYFAVKELSEAIGNAFEIKDLESLMELEEVLNKHLLTVETDLSVMDPIIDILDLFLELLEVLLRFPCTTADGGEIFRVCGASDPTVCGIAISKIIKSNAIDTNVLFPVAQSYTNLPISLLGESETENCGNTPPDGIGDTGRAEKCFADPTSANSIFIEPQFESDGTVISEIGEGSFDSETDVSQESLRIISGGDFEATYSASYTKSTKQFAILQGPDPRKCSFEFAYKGRTNSLAFNDFIYWMIPKRVINENQNSDSPIIPMREENGKMVLDKSFASTGEVRFINPSTGRVVVLEGSFEEGFTVPIVPIPYTDEQLESEVLEDYSHEFPAMLIVDESFAVYKIQKIHIDKNSTDEEIGIHKIDVIRADNIAAEKKRKSVEDESFVAEPGIYYADENFQKLKSFFEGKVDTSDGYFDFTKTTSEGIGPFTFDVPDDESIEAMLLFIKLNDSGGNTLYGNYPFNSAANPENIDSSESSLSTPGTGDYDFVGGEIFKNVTQKLLGFGADTTDPQYYWLDPVTNPTEFELVRDEFVELFAVQEGDIVDAMNNYGSFPFTSYIHKDQTWIDPTNAYVKAYEKSIATAQVFDFPQIYFFDTSFMLNDLIDRCFPVATVQALMNADSGQTAQAINILSNCISECKTAFKGLNDQIGVRLSNGESFTDLVEEPFALVKPLIALQECVDECKDITCQVALSDLSSEFYIVEDKEFVERSDTATFQVGNGSDYASSILEEGVEAGELSDFERAIGADNYSKGIGDNGIFEINQDISIRIVPRFENNDLFPGDLTDKIVFDIISDTGGNAIKTDFELIDPVNSIYEAKIKSSVPTEIEMTASICGKDMSAWAPSGLLSLLDSGNQNVSCNDNELNTEDIINSAFSLSKVIRVLSLTITPASEELGEGLDSSAFGSKQTGQVFGSQE